MITRAQAMTAGMGSSAIGRLTDSGQWVRVGNGVYFATDRNMSHRARMRIACARVGTRSVLSGPSAAWWHRIEPRAATTITITAPRTRHSALLKLLRTADIAGWVANEVVCGYPVDVMFADQKLIVEIDGFAFHSDAAAFQHDRQQSFPLSGKLC